MKSSLKFILFLLAFQMEVRVRASDAHPHEVLTKPEHCLGVTVPCSFKVPPTGWSFSENKIKVSAAADSVLTELRPGREWELVSGALWVKNGPSVTVKTPTASTETSSGEYWVLTKKDQVVFRNISSKLVVTLKDQMQIEIPRGFEMWVGSVDSNAHVQHGMIEPIQLKDHLKIWHSMYTGPKKQFLSEVQDLKDQWVDVVEQSGHIYQKVAERKLAAVEDEKQHVIDGQKKRRELQLRRRQEFYKKVFER